MSKPSKVVMDAAQALVMTLASDETFVSAVAEQEIARRVALGELVPRERLQIMPGLELAPSGRLAALERAARTVVKFSEDLPPEQAWTDEERLLQSAIRQLNSALHHGADPDEDDVEEEAEAAGDDEPEVSTARTVVPEEDDRGPCEECGAEIEENGQARLSWMRWRRVLCREDQRTEPDRRAAADAPAEPEAAASDEEE